MQGRLGRYSGFLELQLKFLEIIKIVWIGGTSCDAIVRTVEGRIRRRQPNGPHGAIGLTLLKDAFFNAKVSRGASRAGSRGYVHVGTVGTFNFVKIER